MMNPELKEGDKIVLVYMKDEQGMTPGTKGVVTRVTEDPYEKDEQLISVDWENGRSLSIISSEDLWMIDSEVKEPIQEQEDDELEKQYGKSIGRSSPFNATAQGTSAAMKQALSTYYDEGLIDTWPQPLGESGVYKLPGVEKTEKLKKTKPETQQRFIQWYDDVIINYDSAGTRGKTFEGLIAGIFGGNVEGNENQGNADKTDVKIITGPSEGENVSVKFNKSFNPEGSQAVGGITKAVQKYVKSEDATLIKSLIRDLPSVKSTGTGLKFTSPAINQILNRLYLHFDKEGVRDTVEKIYTSDDSFDTIDWFLFATEGNLNEIIIYQYKKSDIINHIMSDVDNFSVNSQGRLYVKNLGGVPSSKLLVQFPQYTRTERRRTDTTKRGRSIYDLSHNSVALSIKNKSGDVIGRVRRIVKDGDEIDYFVELLKGVKPINKENKLDFINQAIIGDIRAIESGRIDVGNRKDILDKLKELSNTKQKQLYSTKAKLSKKGKEGDTSRDVEIMNLFGDRGSNLNPFLVQYIRKNPDRFVKRVLDLYGDRPEVQNYIQSLTEQTKDDLTDKLIDSDVNIELLNSLLDELTDEDITDLFLRNLDRKLFKGGDKDKNVKDYISKYVDSLSNRKDSDPNDDYDVEDEFLYGGVEPEKSQIGRKQFKKELLPLQVELLKLQEDVKKTGKAIAVVFEGRDSAGKGSTIKKMTEYLDPKYYNVIALGVPTEEDRKDWFGRYEKHIEPGKINFFDRSWYNRGIVEPVMGYSSEEEYLDFMENVNDFEQSLIDRGIELVKFWLSITPETQKKRFELRKASPLKYWKFSPNDEKSIDKWDDYTEYKNRVMKQTREAKPWTVVDTNDKRAGILNAFRHLLKVVDYEGKDEENVGSVYPEVVTTIKEKEMTESNNYHWSDWQKVVDVLGKENKYLFDFFEKLRQSGVMNMLESTNFVYSGSDYLRRYIEYNEYDQYDESKYEDLYEAADLAKDAMIRIAIDVLEKKGEEPTLDNLNKMMRGLARQAMQSFIMQKSA